MRVRGGSLEGFTSCSTLQATVRSPPWGQRTFDSSAAAYDTLVQVTDTSALPSGIAVVLPARNRETLLGRALASVRAQTVQPIEVIVVDDGSTDGTAQVALAAGATLVALPESMGPGPARNAGILAAKSPWVAFLDSDDEWAETHLELLLEHAGSASLVTAPAIDSSGRVRGNPSGKSLNLTPRRLLVPGDAVVTSGTMVRREVLIDVGLFQSLPRAEDLDLWLRVLDGHEGTATAAPTVRYHQHTSQVSLDADLMRACFDSMLASLADRPWLTEGLRVRSQTMMVWDGMRRAQGQRHWVAAGE